jgi:elongation factor P
LRGRTGNAKLRSFSSLITISQMAAANDLRKGQAIKYNGNTAIVLEVHHRTPGNLRAFVQAIIRYINTGKSADVRFGSTDKVELVEINRATLEFSYKDNNGYHFMDPQTYETITLQDNLIGDAKEYLVENLPVQVLYAESKPVQVELPASVNLKVVESAEGLRGDTASNVTKPARLETGKTINVPLFIKEGETVKIDTRTGAYMGETSTGNSSFMYCVLPTAPHIRMPVALRQ